MFKGASTYARDDIEFFVCSSAKLGCAVMDVLLDRVRRLSQSLELEALPHTVRLCDESKVEWMS